MLTPETIEQGYELLGIGSEAERQRLINLGKVPVLHTPEPVNRRIKVRDITAPNTLIEEDDGELERRSERAEQRR